MRLLDLPPALLPAAARAGAAGWAVEVAAGRAADLHAEDLLAGDAGRRSRRLARVHLVDAPALVLGSAQGALGGIPAEGIDLVRRRSGGGAVWLAPSAQVWVDLVVERGDPLWDDDVGRAAHWVGDAWAAALRAVGERGAVQVHRGAMVRRDLGRVACFAGLGPGEVTVGARKVVGVSQRRARGRARFQTVAYLRWDPSGLLSVVGDDPPGVAHALGDLAGAAVPGDGTAAGAQAGGGAWGDPGTDLLAALLDALP